MEILDYLTTEILDLTFIDENLDLPLIDGNSGSYFINWWKF